MNDRRYRQNFKQKSPQQRFLFVFGIFFFLIYLFMGLAVIFWKDFPLDMNQNHRLLFGIVLIVYAFLRFVRLLQKH
ncbi:MAG: hypothetical protein AB7D46_10065 [Flavobacteriaceae bacterium]